MKVSDYQKIVKNDKEGQKDNKRRPALSFMRKNMCFSILSIVKVKMVFNSI